MNIMNIKHLLKQNRSYRRFDPSVTISREVLVELIELTRFAASARNMQPLRYVLCYEKEQCEQIFPLLSWAGYLRGWAGPSDCERPGAYIVVCKETSLADAHVLFDAGVAVQSILLGAVEKELGGCIIGAVNRVELSMVLDLPAEYEILYVVALGKPAETILIENFDGGSIKYWRDEENVHHVPKRRLNDLII